MLAPEHAAFGSIFAKPWQDDSFFIEKLIYKNNKKSHISHSCLGIYGRQCTLNIVPVLQHSFKFISYWIMLSFVAHSCVQGILAIVHQHHLWGQQAAEDSVTGSNTSQINSSHRYIISYPLKLPLTVSLHMHNLKPTSMNSQASHTRQKHCQSKVWLIHTYLLL